MTLPQYLPPGLQHNEYVSVCEMTYVQTVRMSDPEYPSSLSAVLSRSTSADKCCCLSSRCSICRLASAERAQHTRTGITTCINQFPYVPVHLQRRKINSATFVTFANGRSDCLQINPRSTGEGNNLKMAWKRIARRKIFSHAHALSYALSYGDQAIMRVSWPQPRNDFLPGIQYVSFS